jgi:hypothetical protein
LVGVAYCVIALGVTSLGVVGLGSITFGISTAFATVAITALTLTVSRASIAALGTVATSTTSRFAAWRRAIGPTTFEAGASPRTSWRRSWRMMFLDEIRQLHEFIATQRIVVVGVELFE